MPFSDVDAIMVDKINIRKGKPVEEMREGTRYSVTLSSYTCSLEVSTIFVEEIVHYWMNQLLLSDKLYEV